MNAWVARLLAIVVMGLACWAAVAAAGHLSHTVDEPLHLAVGLEWLEHGTHLLQPENPPLAEIATALAAHHAGQSLPARGQPFRRGTELLYQGGSEAYRDNLRAARLGVLPFFLLSLVLVYAWAQRDGGRGAGLLALVMYATTPVVLGHAGLATTDVAFCATFLLALLALRAWLARAAWGRAAAVGAAVGLALATKFSTLVFLPPALVVLAGYHLGAGRTRPGWRRRLLGAGLAALVAALVFWAAYRFSIGRVLDVPHADLLLDHCFPDRDGLARRLAGWLGRVPLPAPEGAIGLLSLYAHVQQGHEAYLLGATGDRGFWAFYPLALLLKTPLWLLGLIVLGVVGAARRPRRAAPWLPLTLATALLLVAMRSTINIGVRHVLVLYPLFAIGAALGIAAWAPRARWLAAAAAVLLAGQTWTAARTTPDHLAYFNPLAGDDPGAVLLDSDLDWGQDVLQLAELCRERGVDRLHVAVFGSVRLCEHGLPPLTWLQPGQPVRGWVAVSEMYYRGQWRMAFDDPCDRARGRPSQGRDGFRWLDAHTPVARAGRSIRLFRIE